jgi:hypothetical protein
MNANELRRRRNAAIKARNKSRKIGRTYRNKMIRSAMHGANKAAVARNRLAKMKKKNEKEKKKQLVFGLF